MEGFWEDTGLRRTLFLVSIRSSRQDRRSTDRRAEPILLCAQSIEASRNWGDVRLRRSCGGLAKEWLEGGDIIAGTALVSVACTRLTGPREAPRPEMIMLRCGDAARERWPESRT